MTQQTATVKDAWNRLSAAQKPGVGVPFYMRVVNRRLGRAIAATAYPRGTTPNQLTAVSALLAVAAMALLIALPPGPLMAVVVVLLLQSAFAFDAADGQLARLLGDGTPAGEWLDHTVDAARTLVLPLVVAVALAVHADVTEAWLLVPLGVAVVTALRFFALILAEQLQPDRAARGSASHRSAVVQLPADLGVTNLVFVLWPWPTVFLVAFGLLGLAQTALLAATLVRRFRALAVVAPA